MNAAELRNRIIQQLAKSPPSTAAQLAFDLNADLGQIKSALKVLVIEKAATRHDLAGRAPLFTIVHRMGHRPTAHAPSFDAPSPKRHREPQPSRANFDDRTKRMGEVGVERRRAGRIEKLGSAPKARDFLCPDQILGDRS